ncbi:transposase (plasmid) [Shinella sp. WSC3-e]|nr:transposase [Shinella sp. WSC3-e]
MIALVFLLRPERIPAARLRTTSTGQAKDDKGYHRGRHLERPSRRLQDERRQKPAFCQRHRRPSGLPGLAEPARRAHRLRADRSLSPGLREKAGGCGLCAGQGQPTPGKAVRRSHGKACQDRPARRCHAGAHGCCTRPRRAAGASSGPQRSQGPAHGPRGAGEEPHGRQEQGQDADPCHPQASQRGAAQADRTPDRRHRERDHGDRQGRSGPRRPLRHPRLDPGRLDHNRLRPDHRHARARNARKRRGRLSRRPRPRRTPVRQPGRTRLHPRRPRQRPPGALHAGPRRHALQSGTQGKVPPAQSGRQSLEARNNSHHAKAHRAGKRPAQGPSEMDKIISFTKTDTLGLSTLSRYRTCRYSFSEARIKELEKAAAHMIGVKDIVGVLKPAVAKVLIKALRGRPICRSISTRTTGPALLPRRCSRPWKRRRMRFPARRRRPASARLWTH